MSRNEKIIDEIIKDLRDRSGLGNEWDNIDEEIQQEIKKDWLEILNNYPQ